MDLIVKNPVVLLLVAIGMTLLVYWNGLNGPFLFDDHVHISQNRWVKIQSLDLHSLTQAWNSSFSAFPSNRPLSQLTFGINHAIAGLDPKAFKAVNLAIHLINGVLVYLFVRLGFTALTGRAPSSTGEKLLPVAVAAVWLLHPMHVSTVLYAVQRMTQLSTLSLLLALLVYLHGRVRIAADRPGRLWMLSAAPIALLGFLAKENTVLLPLLLLAVELTLLQNLPRAPGKGFVRAVHVLYIGVPLIVGAGYLLTHSSGLLDYSGRPFTFEERVLTQPRILWLYLQWLLIPDIAAFGLFHDDIPISTGWLKPATTLVATIAWPVTLLAAFVYRRRAPVIAFAVFFYLACHALESTIFPLEMVFEHRNYLASVGPLALLGYLIVVYSRRLQLRSAALILGALLLVSYAVVTFLRVDNWSSYRQFVIASTDHHPASQRTNFMAAQYLIAAVAEAGPNASTLVEAAHAYLDAGLRSPGGCINCLFGKVVLALQTGRQPSAEVFDELRRRLRTGDVGPTKVSVTQFSFLSRWHRSDGTRLPHAQFTALFEDALANPGWRHTGRAAIEASYREYHEFVTGDLAVAERHARAALAAWPQQWGYHAHLVRVLRKRGHHDEAWKALEKAESSVRNAKQRQDLAQLKDAVRKDRH